MPVQNAEIAEMFDQTAELLEIRVTILFVPGRIGMPRALSNVFQRASPVS